MAVSAAIQPPETVTLALRQAAAETGIGFDYLLATAMRESSLDSAAQAPTSSAAGLFQFIESTWLSVLKEAGPRFGLGEISEQITRGEDGRYMVADPEVRHQILGLRHDPKISALMAGELTRRNSAQLSAEIGRNPTQGELYVAHFLGAAGAARLIDATDRDPNAAAAEKFPRAAAANRLIFYTQSGRERSLAQVYELLTDRHHGGGGPAESPATREATARPFFAALFNVTADEARQSVPIAQKPAAGRLAAEGAYRSQIDWFRVLYRDNGPATRA